MLSGSTEHMLIYVYDMILRTLIDVFCHEQWKSKWLLSIIMAEEFIADVKFCCIYLTMPFFMGYAE